MFELQPAYNGVDNPVIDLLSLCDNAGRLCSTTAVQAVRGDTSSGFLAAAATMEMHIRKSLRHSSFETSTMKHPHALLWLTLAMIGNVHAQTCYQADGTVHKSDKPCKNNPNACCSSAGAADDLCYDNGFCFSVYYGKIYRGSCTDSSFGAAGCATKCVDRKSRSGLFYCCNGVGAGLD